MKSFQSFFWIGFFVCLIFLVACDGSRFESIPTDVTPTVGSPEDGGEVAEQSCEETATNTTDTDADGTVDDCDDDDDGDGILDVDDNCPVGFNAEQTDTDQDGQGDVCDSDNDGDGKADVDDNCSMLSNADQADLDGDGEGDACDTDDDGDGTADVDDNCPITANEDQLDTDSDGAGDECDDDDDGDGVADSLDAFPKDATETVDTDGDGVGNNADVCPLKSDNQKDSDADGVGDACDNCVNAANLDQANQDGDTYGDACDQDIDGDGDLAIEFGGTDCDDENAAISGVHAEIFDLIDNNCDGVVDLSVDLADSTATIEGLNAGDELGYAVSILGDVNGDGYADVMIGAPKNDDSASGAGKAYLFFGDKSGLSGELDPDSADVIISGSASNNYFGWSIAGPGDVNGDGYDDILIGAKWNNEAGTRAGKVYLIYGRAFSSQTFSLSSADATFKGSAAYDYLGTAVSGAGDVNGDGKADILMSATGYDGTYSAEGLVYLFYGGSLSGAVSLSSAKATFRGEAAYDAAGTALSTAGDMDGDGLSDFIVGVPSSDPSGRSGAGRVYVVFADSFSAGANNLSSANLKFIGEAAGNNAGNAISGGVDVNGDGLGDIIIGAYGYDVTSSSNEGRAYLIFGSDSYTAGTYNLSTADVIFTGESNGDYAGKAVSLASDMNGDGFGEIFIGAYYNDEVASNAGKVYFYTGRAEADFDAAITLGDSSADATILGETSGSYAGDSLSSSGDINGDGRTDLVVGASGYDGEDGLDTGKAYLLLLE